jgi:hypothetical protein
MSDTYNNIQPYDIDTLTIGPNTIKLDPGVFSIDPNTLTVQGYNGSGMMTGILSNGATDTITLSDYNWNSHQSLDVKGDANFDGDLIIKGKSLAQTLEKIEDKLAILRPNEALEEKWEQLRELRRQYMELEKDIIEKEKIWDILKK